MNRTLINLIYPIAIAAAVVGDSVSFGQFLVGVASDDVWAYDRAANPGGDSVIRVWGYNGDDLNPAGYPGVGPSVSFWSYGFVSWDLSNVPPGYEWNGATITLTVEQGVVYDPAVDDVYLRLITDGFDEDTWVFGVGPAPIYGLLNRVEADDSQAANGPGSKVTFEIPKNIPRFVLARWARTGRIDAAITSTADFLNDDRFFRFASNNNLLYDGPMLELK
jgi:hypothetical protein